jgi:3-isopropylmalate/(R)-2-methylmalate dehydratase small subunit
VRFTFDTAELVLADHGVTIELEPLPQFLREMILDGGLVPHLEKRFLADADEREK